MKLRKGFTLSETLIALVIIGVVAAMTIPSLIANSQWEQYKTGARKAISVLNQASIKWHTINGTIAECGYWKTSPYSGKGCTAQCVGYNDLGNCTGYTCKETGSPLPGDYNGYFDDCTKLYNFYKEHMNVIKVCDSNAYANGCIPEYEGNDTVYMAKNEEASETDANQATSGCAGFRKSNILAGKAFVTGDGMIFFPYSSSGARIMAVDVNGQKGPNKWGYDVRSFVPKLVDPNSDASYTGGGCEIVEKGGIATNTLLYRERKY